MVVLFPVRERWHADSIAVRGIYNLLSAHFRGHFLTFVTSEIGHGSHSDLCTAPSTRYTFELTSPGGTPAPEFLASP
jgi:hypothetical protein